MLSDEFVRQYMARREKDEAEARAFRMQKLSGEAEIPPELLTKQERIVSQEVRDKISNQPLRIKVLPDIENQLPSIDFREHKLVGRLQNQGETCHTCWSHAAISMIESVYMKDREDIKGLSPYFVNDTDDHIVQISTAFLMTNQHIGGYCDGGDAQMSIASILRDFGSFDTEEHYKKSYGLWQSVFYRNESLPLLITPEQMYFPSKVFYSSYTGNYHVYVHIFYSTKETYPPDVVHTIKSYLNRGISVLTAAKSTGPQMIKYNVYSGEYILTQKCYDFYASHQVQIIGYGKKNGKNVWVIKNSWGLGWGSYGCYFVEIGSDANCVEHDASVIIPAQYVEGDYLKDVPHIRGGRKGRFFLDRDPGDPIVNDLTGSWYSTQPVPVIREQTYEIITFLALMLLPPLSCFLVYIIYTICNITAMNKMQKNIVAYNKQYRRLKEFIRLKEEKSKLVENAIEKVEPLS